MGIYLLLAIPCKCSVGDCLRYWCFTDDKYILFNSLVPECLLFFKRQLFIPQCIKLCSVAAICDIKRIKTCFTVDFKNLCILLAKGSLCHFTSVYETSCVRGFIILFIPEVPSTECVAHVHIHENKTINFIHFNGTAA